MAEKKLVTAVIDSVEERLPDNERGWGKYKLFIEGMKGVQKVDVPADVNAEFDLEEGMTVTLQEGPYKGWIALSTSECFTGEPYEAKPAAAEPKRTVTKRRGPAKNSSDESEEDEPRESKVATPRSGNVHTAWNQYQIDIRDPQMRMQVLLEITAKVHCACIEHNCDPNEAMAAIMSDAEKLDQEVVKYLKIKI